MAYPRAVRLRPVPGGSPLFHEDEGVLPETEPSVDFAHAPRSAPVEVGPVPTLGHGAILAIDRKVKETVGILTSDKKMEREGSLQRAEGAVQEGLGKAGRKVGEAMTNLGNAIKK